LPGRGDITREQLQDIPGVDSLYFTMLNGNKRSLTLNTKTPDGKKIFEALIKHCDVLVENFGRACSTAKASPGRRSRS
jgi:formyl-CoA transferase